MATAQSPTLPAEIWLRVLQNLQEPDDLPELWTSYRHVSTTFKQAVEAIMRENHLRKTWLRFQLGGHNGSLNCDFEFSHLSDDNTRATFKIAERDNDDEEKSEIQSLLRLALEDRLRLVQFPNYMIQIHKEVFDGPIPDIEVDYENLQLTSDWRGIYDAFFGEEKMYYTLMEQCSKEQETFAGGLRVKMERGELNMMDVMKQIMERFGSVDEEARKLARRHRIRTEYLRVAGTEWDADLDGYLKKEEKALKKVKELRFYASMEDRSDDEDGTSQAEGDEEDDDEDNEEDEWEDEEDEEGSDATSD